MPVEEAKPPLPTGTVAVCCMDTARYTDFWHSVSELELPPGWKLVTIRGAIISWMRHKAATSFEGDYLLFLDDDHVVPPDLISRLVAHEKDVVGVAYVDRHLLSLLVPTDAPPGLHECGAIGAAGMMIHRRVFEALDPPYFRSRTIPASEVREDWSEEWDEDWDNHQIPVSEDLDFCKRVCAAGFQIFIDSTIMMPHLTVSTLSPVYDVAEGWRINVGVGLDMFAELATSLTGSQK